MSGAAVIRLVLMALVFIAWAWLMFRTLFLLRRRGEAETGAMFPGPMATMRQIGIWLRNPADRSDRRTLFFLTLVLVAMIAMQALIVEA